LKQDNKIKVKKQMPAHQTPKSKQPHEDDNEYAEDDFEVNNVNDQDIEP
jgi:hypothetical protein